MGKPKILLKCSMTSLKATEDGIEKIPATIGKNTPPPGCTCLQPDRQPRIPGKNSLKNLLTPDPPVSCLTRWYIAFV